MPPLRIHGNEAVFVRMNNALQNVFGEGGSRRVTPLPRNRMAAEQALLTPIETGGKSLLRQNG